MAEAALRRVRGRRLRPEGRSVRRVDVGDRPPDQRAADADARALSPDMSGGLFDVGRAAAASPRGALKAVAATAAAAASSAATDAGILRGRRAASSGGGAGVIAARRQSKRPGAAAARSL
jgi:hypothetical protein